MPPPSDRSGHRRPEDIEAEISAIRSRLGDTLSEIERRFSGQGPISGAAGYARDYVVEGAGPEVQRLAVEVWDGIRRNPLPALLVGIGAVWLAVEVVRLRGEGGREGRVRTIDLLADLTGVARQGAKALRRAAVTMEPGTVREALRLAAMDRGETANLLQMELRQSFGVDAVHGAAPTGDRLGTWARVERLVDAGETRGPLMEAITAAEEETLGRFRDALYHPMPDHARVVIGGRFHEVEGTRARLLSLAEAVG
ncbi:MAG: hypothetical protein RLY86_2492 [Pseudomonadota bacterium]|jgi:hypothetical protein